MPSTKVSVENGEYELVPLFLVHPGSYVRYMLDAMKKAGW